MIDNALGNINFQGFPSGETNITNLPEAFFIELLPIIDDLDELKITLYMFWCIQQVEGEFRYTKLSAMLEDKVLRSMLQPNENGKNYGDILENTLSRAVIRGSLVVLDFKEKNEKYYFLNSPNNREKIKNLLKDSNILFLEKHSPVGLDLIKSNVFKLYEQNIGLLTPHIADLIKDAELEYPSEWIEDAIRISVENNARNWHYISSILASWKKRGRNGKN